MERRADLYEVMNDACGRV